MTEAATTTTSDLAAASDRVRKEMGFVFDGDNLRGKLLEAIMLLNYPIDCAAAKRILQGQWNTVETPYIIEAITNGETYFFRHADDLATFQNELLQPRLHACALRGEPLRIWSAACSTGEEAYTLSILIDAISNSHIVPPVAIIGSDINAAHIHTAQLAEYREWSFRESAANFRDSYFESPATGKWRPLSRIRNRVTFLQHNLLDQPKGQLAQPFDFIFCRNVFIYFSSDSIRSILTHLRTCLKENGWLIVSPSEASVLTQNGWVMHRINERLFFQAGSAHVPMRHLPVAPDPKPTRPNPSASKRQKPTPRVATNKLPLLGHLPAEPAPHTPADALAHVRQLADQGHYETALQTVENILLQDNTQTTAHIIKAQILSEMQQVEPAQRCLRDALFLEPERMDARIALTQLLIQQNRLAEARKQLQILVRQLGQITPDSPIDHLDGVRAGQLLAEVNQQLTDLA